MTQCCWVDDGTGRKVEEAKARTDKLIKAAKATALAKVKDGRVSDQAMDPTVEEEGEQRRMEPAVRPVVGKEGEADGLMQPAVREEEEEDESMQPVVEEAGEFLMPDDNEEEDRPGGG